MCFTMISTHNLIPSATSMTGQNSCKTCRFYRVVRLVASCPSFIALKCKKLPYLGCYLRLSSTTTIGHDGRNLLVVGAIFCLCGGIFRVRLCCGAVSVLDLYFGECSSCSSFLLLSDRELVRLVLLVALKCTANVCVL